MNINLKIILIIISLAIFMIPANAEIIIYDNITTSQYKTLIIQDNQNIKYLTDYTYKVFINGNYFGDFKEDEIIQFPDNSDIIVFAQSPIKTDLKSGIDLGSSLIVIVVMGILVFGGAIYIIILFIRKMRR